MTFKRDWTTLEINIIKKINEKIAPVFEDFQSPYSIYHTKKIEQLNSDTTPIHITVV